MQLDLLQSLDVWTPFHYFKQNFHGVVIKSELVDRKTRWLFLLVGFVVKTLIWISEDRMFLDAKQSKKIVCVMIELTRALEFFPVEIICIDAVAFVIAPDVIWELPCFFH